MPIAKILVFVALVASACPSVAVIAQDAGALQQLRDRGAVALQQRDQDTAQQLADRLGRDFDQHPAAWRLAGDLYLRSGDPAKAVPQFRRYIQQVPEHEPELWQYGIALALVGQFEAGQALFEKHRTVNPHDVENALWHFYCVAKADGAEAARQAILPAPGDTRVPMEQLRQLYRGESDEAAVQAAVAALPADSAARQRADFYAQLYLAMLADAQGQRDTALAHAKRAAAADQTNYMTDVGRLYFATLRDAEP